MYSTKINHAYHNNITSYSAHLILCKVTIMHGYSGPIPDILCLLSASASLP